MKLSTSALALGVVLTLAPAAAFADAVPGWYVGGASGISFLEDSTGHTSAGNSTISYNSSLAFAASGGYAWYNGLRAEGEVFYDRGNVDKISGRTGTDGHLSNIDFFVNGLYDFNTGTMFTPYVGAGVGVALVTAKNIGPLANNSVLSEDDKAAFAYQGIVGLATQFDKNWAFTVDYRYVGTAEPKLKVSSGGSSKTTDDSHNIMFGLRYSFGEPALPVAETANPPRVMAKPAAKVAPAAQEPSFIVFFDFDKDKLTPEAKRIIASAADAYRQNGYAKIIVTGHTDTVGSKKYNGKLSHRRAMIVKDELRRLGVAPKSIVAKGEGKDVPMVSTPDGVRESHNRRAEIVLTK